MIRLLSLVVASVATAAVLVGAPPAWLLEAAKTPTPSGLSSEAGAHVLLDEEIVDVAPTGKTIVTTRYAVRILNQKGDPYASVAAEYDEKSDKVLDGRAWLVRGGKAFKEESIGKWIDVCQDSAGTVFTEQRAKVVTYASTALVGDVFGAEYRVERPLLFAQLSHVFTWGLATAREHYGVRLPPGWRLETLEYGTQPPAESVASPQTWDWTVADAPYLPSEDWAPWTSPDVPGLLIKLYPPEGARIGNLAVLDSWSEVGEWHEKISAGQCDSDALLKTVAARVCEGCSDTTARIRAIGTHVQRIRYVAVNKNLGMGYGARPRKATEVLARAYGDCKDKANLMVAMLREVGVTAHMVAVSASMYDSIAEEWPSPCQFNHAIVAVEVDASVDLPTVVGLADGRRLLFFDPTADCTMLGDLPWILQGTTGLVKLGADSILVDLPKLSPADEWHYRTTGRLEIRADGVAGGSAEFRAGRQAGAGRRAGLRDASPKDRTEWATRYMSTMLRGVVVRDVEYRDEAGSDDAVLTFNLAAPGVFQDAPGGLVLMRLDVFNRDSVPQFPARERIQPVKIGPIVDEEEIEFVLGAGLVVSELPKKVNKSSPYGSFERTVEVKDGNTLVLRRRMELHPQIVPASDYSKLRAFLTDAARADKSAVVLSRSP